jgi:hypothetical protein
VAKFWRELRETQGISFEYLGSFFQSYFKAISCFLLTPDIQIIHRIFFENVTSQQQLFYEQYMCDKNISTISHCSPVTDLTKGEASSSSDIELVALSAPAFASS